MRHSSTPPAVKPAKAAVPSLRSAHRHRYPRDTAGSSQRRVNGGVEGLGLGLCLCLGLASLGQAQDAPAPPLAARALSTPAAAAAQTQYRDALKLVEVWADAQVAFERLPGLTAGVVLGQDLVWSQTWGTLDHRRRVPTRTDTIYSICSISKLFTAVAVMQQWEEGRLSLDDDIGKHLPGFALQRSDADSGPITIRALLSHAAGLPREADFPYWTPPDFKFPTREQLLQGLSSQRTIARTSERYQYSNLGMALLGEVVAATSGMPYADYVQQRILNPLKLSDTAPRLPAPLWGTRLAQGFGAIKRDGQRDPVPLFDAQGLAAAAGFSSTLPDLARFAAWQFRLHKAGGQEVLKAATLRDMHRVQWTSADGKDSWGLGFAVGRDGANTVVSHAGVCPGQLASLVLALKDEVAVVAMANANDNSALNRLTRPMRQIMLKGLRLPVAPSGPGQPDLAAYAGRYDAQPWGSESVVLPWGKGLVTLGLPSRDPAADMRLLVFVEGDRFRFENDDGSAGAEVTFERDTAGKVTGAREWGQLTRKLP